MDKPGIEVAEIQWGNLYKAGGIAAFVVVLVALIEIIITYLPGGERVSPDAVSVVGWFMLFRDHWFIGLRNLGLLNIIMTILGIPIFYSLYAAHRRVNQAYGTLAMIFSFIGVAVFFATNRAFPMLELSRQYAAATTDTQRAMLTAAGQAMLSVGQSHTPGTFLGFFLSEIAGIMISLVMLRGNIFSKTSAWAGILGGASLLIFEVCSSFIPALFNAAMIFAMCGGLMTMTWYILLGLKLLQLGSSLSAEAKNRN